MHSLFREPSALCPTLGCRKGDRKGQSVCLDCVGSLGLSPGLAADGPDRRPQGDLGCFQVLNTQQDLVLAHSPYPLPAPPPSSMEIRVKNRCYLRNLSGFRFCFSLNMKECLETSHEGIIRLRNL